MIYFNLFSDYFLFVVGLFVLLGSLLITFKTRFVQFSFFPKLLKIVFSKTRETITSEEKHSIHPHHALLTAMSTTLGIGTIVGPVIAIRLGGPGALLGFLLTAFLGSAATYSEVALSIKFRKKLPSGEILGGPMQYIQQLISPKAAKWYAIFGVILLSGWSAAQANQLVAILNSPLLGSYRISSALSGTVIAAGVLLILTGGIKRVSAIASKIVPIMFFLYIGTTLWILFSNVDQLGKIFKLIFDSAFTPYSMATGGIIGGIVGSMRWGLFKGMQATEAGIGTQSIPHSLAETNDPDAQGTLAMISTFSAGIISFLSGCVVLLTNTWQDPELPLGISMVAASYKLYFSYLGIALITICTLLFAFGTIVGNSFNGSQCFCYLTDNKKVRFYYLGTAAMIFIGSILDAKTIWSLIDFSLVFLVVPHMAAIVIYVFKKSTNISMVSHGA